MTTPQTTNKEKEKKEEKILFSMRKEFEITKREKYNEFLREYQSELEVSIDGQKFIIKKDQDFDDILKSLQSKIAVLRYVSDGTYQSIAQEILLDFAVIMYKLSYKHRY
jgi:hypothetical protein